MNKDFIYPDEYVEFLLCKKFNKLPHEFDNMPANVLELWRQFLNTEAKAEELRQKRANQKRNGR